MFILPKTSGANRRVDIGAVMKWSKKDTQVTREKPTNFLINDLLVSAILQNT